MARSNLTSYLFHLCTRASAVNRPSKPLVTQARAPCPHVFKVVTAPPAGVKGQEEQIFKQWYLYLGGDVQLRLETYTRLTAPQKLQVARHPQRPTFLDIMCNICDNFFELHGDRAGYDDPAIVCGLARIDGVDFMAIGQQKGRNTKVQSHGYSPPFPSRLHAGPAMLTNVRNVTQILKESKLRGTAMMFLGRVLCEVMMVMQLKNVLSKRIVCRRLLCALVSRAADGPQAWERFFCSACPIDR